MRCELTLNKDKIIFLAVSAALFTCLVFLAGFLSGIMIRNRTHGDNVKYAQIHPKAISHPLMRKKACQTPEQTTQINQKWTLTTQTGK
jgi:hypothetical protein